ncbi:ama1 protein [Novymonas esmeraldas]|uniref:Ama1 protein n=1 Tax=Novymonas esmeraldas TaxID=1808958 RepID=A0AAW0EJL6_9TRYP
MQSEGVYTKRVDVPPQQPDQQGGAAPARESDVYLQPKAPPPPGSYGQGKGAGYPQSARVHPGEPSRDVHYTAAGDPSDVPINLTTARYRHRPWHYSLCVCCQDMDSCCESWWCLCCQLSRQCNMLVSNSKEIHWPYCLLMTFVDLCTGYSIVTCLFAMETRRLARERYGVKGSCCGDCCASWCCRSCSTQQVLLEMTVMNDFPGATCYTAVQQPTSSRMV